MNCPWAAKCVQAVNMYAEAEMWNPLKGYTPGRRHDNHLRTTDATVQTIGFSCAKAMVVAVG